MNTPPYTAESLLIAYQWAQQHPKSSRENRRMFADLALQNPAIADGLLVKPSEHKSRKNSRGIIVSGAQLIQIIAFQPAS